MHTRTCASIAVLAVLVGPGVTAGQWVSFTDETGARLTLNAFADNPGGNPLLDGNEKDIAVGDLDLDGLDDVIIVRKLPFSNAGARRR